MNELNVFYNYYRPWIYPINWITNVKTFFKSFKYCWQRITKGYCDKDLWNLDNTILAYLTQTLLQFSQISQSYPGDQEFNTFEKWQKYLEEIAFNFLKINHEDIYFSNPYEEKFYNQLTNNFTKQGHFSIQISDEKLKKQFIDAEIKRNQDREELFKENWNNLGRIFFHLWD